MSSSSSNFTGPTGGDSLTQDVNAQYDLANISWVLVAGALVWIMIPGVGLLYSGMSRKKHSLSLAWAGLMTASLVAFQWFFWGYSLTFSHEAGKFLGKLDNFALMNVLAAPSVGSALIPDILFMFYQSMFACTTGMIMVGGAHERARLGPMMVYLFIWMTIVYCPIAEWTWNPKGWVAVMGGLDFAGGGPVHMTSGAGALAYALICGKRHDPLADKIPVYKPHSVNTMVLGTILLWFGWFGFNGGSSLNATIRGVYAACNTNVAAASGALSWMFIDYFRKGRKWSTVALCSGVVAGLVGITPASGFVPIYTAVPIGVLAAAGANFAADLKYLLHIDDGLDVFAIHAVGGFVGSMCTGLFAADYIAALDGFTAISGGWINHHWIQLAFQLASATATLGWSFGVSYVTLFTLNKIPYLKLRLSAEEEELGTDHAEIGEVGYEWYVEEMNPIQGLTPSSGPSSVNKDHEDAEKIPGTPQTSAGPA